MVPAHGGGDYLHAESPLVEFFLPWHPDSSGPLDIAPLKREVDSLNPPALGRPTESRLGPLVPSAPLNACP